MAELPENRPYSLFGGVKEEYVDQLEAELASHVAQLGKGWQAFEDKKAELANARQELASMRRQRDEFSVRCDELARERAGLVRRREEATATARRERELQAAATSEREHWKTLAKAEGEKLRQAEARLVELSATLRQTEARLTELSATLNEDLGWSERLRHAVWDLSRLAAGRGGSDDHVAAAIHYVTGHHLLSRAAIFSGEDVAQEAHTERDARGSPVSTTTGFGGRVARCDWMPGLTLAPEYVVAVQELCHAALISLAAVDTAAAREGRGIVTQLGDELSLRRHHALRRRIGRQTAQLSIEVDRTSAAKHRALFGEIAWNASWADAGAALEVIAHRHGGQAYQVDAFAFRLLVDADREALAYADAQYGLAGRELRFDLRAGR